MAVKPDSPPESAGYDERRMRYEHEKRGKVVFRVQMTPSDSAEEWEKIKEWLKADQESIKAGIYARAKGEGVI